MTDSTRIHPLSDCDRATLPTDGGEHYNRLIFEESPYLLQHAANPVDWYPWGDEAFARARQLDRPVFLSIGYATCHWCHVMEDESFADAAVADLLNRSFIAIKVDREERPDIDRLYMNACQLISGSGGWPLTLLLTPERLPFFAATYLPRASSGSRFGLIDLLYRSEGLWRDERAKVLAGANEIAAALRRSATQTATDAAPLDESPLRAALRQFRGSFDQRHGGFGLAPKFPAPHQLSLLLRLAGRFVDEDAAHMALTTLHALARGGIHDQIGGGLHRYSTDAQWYYPHFEKTLYDQALLIVAALDGYRDSGDTECAELAASLVDYLLGELRDESGGFYCGEDADSGGEEGAYYLWGADEIVALLGPADGEQFCRCFRIDNDERALPQRRGDWTTLAAAEGLDESTLTSRLAVASRLLLQERNRRPRPLLDDKIILGWNGLAVAALARAAAELNRADCLSAAEAGATFLLSALRRADGRLLRRWRRGRTAIPAFLDDYAALIHGLIELYRVTGSPEQLLAAVELADQACTLFIAAGTFSYVGRDDHQLPLPAVALQDGALPSGEALLVHDLLRLGRLAARPDLLVLGRELLARHLDHVGRYPMAYAYWLIALDEALATEAP